MARLGWAAPGGLQPACQRPGRGGWSVTCRRWGAQPPAAPSPGSKETPCPSRERHLRGGCGFVFRRSGQSSKPDTERSARPAPSLRTPQNVCQGLEPVGRWRVRPGQAPWAGTPRLGWGSSCPPTPRPPVEHEKGKVVAGNYVKMSHRGGPAGGASGQPRGEGTARGPTPSHTGTVSPSMPPRWDRRCGGCGRPWPVNLGVSPGSTRQRPEGCPLPRPLSRAPCGRHPRSPEGGQAGAVLAAHAPRDSRGRR